MNPRAEAVRALARALEGDDFEAALAVARNATDVRNRAFVQELVYGTLRHYRELGARRAMLLDHPERLASRTVATLLLVGLYELAALATPRHAAVHAAVEAARELGEDWAAKLVNAVLRRALREQKQPLGESARDEYPPWLLTKIERDWGSRTHEILAAGLGRAPLTLRVNRLRTSREEYLRRLASTGIAASAGAHAPSAITLTEPRPASSVPGYQGGLVSVQDEAAQLAAGLLALEPGQRVLDACVAPGGKAAHILETEPRLSELVGLDRDPVRLASARENLRRLDLTAQLVVGDGLRPEHWWDGVPFARILIDAPCTATGVMRRHPDVRILRHADDLARAKRRQTRLLSSLWGLLAPGGRLVYTVCSLLSDEGEDVIVAFLGHAADARSEPIPGEWGEATGHGRRIAPGESGMDSFFYAVIIKT